VETIHYGYILGLLGLLLFLVGSCNSCDWS